MCSLDFIIFKEVLLCLKKYYNGKRNERISIQSFNNNKNTTDFEQCKNKFIAMGIHLTLER